jgi:hypothetical protein
MVQAYLDSGRLVAPFGNTDRSGAAYYLVYPADEELSVPARRVARWLTEVAAAPLPSQPASGWQAPASHARSSLVSVGQPESAP